MRYDPNDSRERAQAAGEMLSTHEYLHLAARHRAFTAWLGERCSYDPKDVPAGLEMTNEERSALERYEFFYGIPTRYFLYIPAPKRWKDSGVATTWTGERLGRVTFGTPYRDNFGGTRVPVWIDSINGHKYAGTYYASSGDYARVKLVKGH